MAEYQQRKWWKWQANTVISRKFYGPHKHILRRSTENSSARAQKFFWWSDGINTQHAHAQVHVSARARVWSRAHLTPIFCRLSEFSHQSTRKTLFQNVLSSNTICPIHLELWRLPKECWRFGVFQNVLWRFGVFQSGEKWTFYAVAYCRWLDCSSLPAIVPPRTPMNSIQQVFDRIVFFSSSNSQFCMCLLQFIFRWSHVFLSFTMKSSFYLTIIQLL